MKIPMVILVEEGTVDRYRYTLNPLWLAAMDRVMSAMGSLMPLRVTPPSR